jgi:hypothetical protein
MAHSVNPSCFLIFRAVLGSISRDGSVVSRSPTKTIMCPPFPRRFQFDTRLFAPAR